MRESAIVSWLGICLYVVYACLRASDNQNAPAPRQPQHDERFLVELACIGTCSVRKIAANLTMICRVKSETYDEGVEIDALSRTTWRNLYTTFPVIKFVSVGKQQFVLFPPQRKTRSTSRGRKKSTLTLNACLPEFVKTALSMSGPRSR